MTIKPNTPPQNAQKVDLTMQQTVKRMQEHFVSTGEFRAEDVVKVLGDPLKGVTLHLPEAFSASSGRVES